MKFLLVCAALMLCIILTFGQEVGEWAPWSSCSRTCGGGTRSRTRSCAVNVDCKEARRETESCSTEACPVCYCESEVQPCQNSDEALCSRLSNTQCLQPVYSSFCPVRCNSCFQPVRRICPCGDWAEWAAAPCSTTCGAGTRIRTRECTPPTSPCFGSGTETRSCNLGRCGRTGEPWRSWGSWSRCSKTCGTGISVRIRRCPLFRFCFGVFTQERACNIQPCRAPVSRQWSSCSKTCGWGTQVRKACAQCSTEYQSCKIADCLGFCNPPSIPRYGLQSHDCCTDSLTPGLCGIPSASNAQSLVNRFPWIGYVWAGSNFCATVLINNFYSLVAADCVWGKQANTLLVVFGISANDEYNSPNEQMVFVEKIHIHPSYTPSANEKFNIAILQFKTSINQTSFVRPVCLPQQETVQFDQQCIALEWLKRPLSVGAYPQRDLKQSFLRVFPTGACNLNAIPTTQRPTVQQILCAGPNRAGTGQCENVSGTPLVCQRCSSCAWMVAGMSHQNSCSNPTAAQRFTQVSFYQAWIDGIIPPANPLTFFPSCS